MSVALMINISAEEIGGLPESMQQHCIRWQDAVLAQETLADLVIIGPSVENAAFYSQLLMQLNPHAELVLLTTAEQRANLAIQLRITPFIPIGVAVLDINDKATLHKVMNDTFKLIEHKRSLTQAMHEIANLSVTKSFAADLPNENILLADDHLAGDDHIPPKASLPRQELPSPSSDSPSDDSPYYNSPHNNSPDIKTQRRLFSAVVEASNDSILSCTLEGVISSWNPTAQHLYGFTAEEAIGRSIKIIVRSDQHAEFMTRLQQVAQGDRIRNFTTLFVTRGERQIDVSLNLSPIEDDRGKTAGALIIARDISGLAELQAYQHAVLDAAIDVIITIDHVGVIVEFNPAAQTLFGYTRPEAIGNTLEELIIPPKYRQAHRDGMARFLKTGEGPALGKRIELSAIRRNGEEFPVELSIVQLKGRNPPLFTGFLRDLTATKQAEAELHRLVTDLKRSNEELEQFAYVASHDLKEPLRIVNSYAELLAQRNSDKPDDKAEKYIRYIVEGATRMRRMIDDLLTYSRLGLRESQLKPVNCQVVLEQVLSGLSLAIKEKGAQVIYDELPVVRGDHMMLGDIFQNLIQNSLKFHSDAAPIIHISVKPEDSYWLFSIADNGMGFDMVYAKRLFQMFQRLHGRGEYEGSGMGLALVKKIIERHGGRIWVESKPDAGATFYFTLPAHEGDEEVVEVTKQ